MSLSASDVSLRASGANSVQRTGIAWGFFVSAAIGTVTASAALTSSLPPMTALHRSAAVRTAAPVQTSEIVVLSVLQPLSERVSNLRESTGLTAQQLARLFDVSRRSVNHWLAGKPMAENHEARLERLEQVAQQLPGSTGAERRRALLSSTGGPSLYQQLCAEVRTSEPLQGVGLTVEEQIR